MEVPVYMTIRQTAKLGFITEYRIRKLVHSKNCPGYYVGNRFMVDV